VPGALLAQNREGGFGDVDDAKQVRVDLRAKRVERHVLDGGEVGVAGVVDYDVEAAERVNRALHGLVGGRILGDVERDGGDLVAVASDEIVELPGPARGRDYRVPICERSLSDRTTEAAGAASDEEDLRHFALLSERFNYPVS
jgi:hypothetical protein